MRNLLVAGTAGLLIALGAAGAANAANPNVPTYSPYTIMNIPGSVPEADRTSKPVAEADRVYGYNQGSGMVEGRAAFVDEGQPGYGPDDGYGRPGYRNADRYDAPFPFSVLPWNW